MNRIIVTLYIYDKLVTKPQTRQQDLEAEERKRKKHSLRIQQSLSKVVQLSFGHV